MLNRLLAYMTHRLYEVPVLVLMPHSRCNCRCVMCDIWKANNDKREISPEELERHIEAFKELKVKHVTLSGGEALMHPNLWKLCLRIRSLGAHISLLSTGLTLKSHAAEIVRHVDDVIVSLDGSAEVHDAIRGVPRAFEKLQQGVLALKELNSSFRVTARCVLQKTNYNDFCNIITSARNMGLDQISFLAADASSSAFNRAQPWEMDKRAQVVLDADDIPKFEEIIIRSTREFPDLYQKKFIAEAPSRMLELPQYYRALLGEGKFPVRKCNAPWVSAVVEADGEVRPCFFHKSYGNIHNSEFSGIINSPQAISFRKTLKVSNDPICERCVCSLKL